MIFDVDEYAKNNPEKADPLLQALRYLIGTDDRGVAQGGLVRTDAAQTFSKAVSGAAETALRPAAEAVSQAIMKAVSAKRFAEARSLARKYNQDNPSAPGLSVDKLMKRSKQTKEEDQ